MTLLLDAGALAARARAVRAPDGDLAALAASLGADLHTAIAHEPAIPREKALLSRDGGRCPRHAAPLAFDPFAPHDHRCPVDGEIVRGARHDRWWITWAQLWLAERMVHAAALAALGVEPGLAAFVQRLADGYVAHYLEYPNRDNVLGPSRPFFSTYLESIWLLQLCVALDLLETAGLAGSIGGRLRDRVLAPSLALIASYDEGGSNRQVWNDAAMIAAGTLLGELAVVDRAVGGPSGVLAQLQTGLLADGTWYEGENYHFFAHRGLWYAVTMLERLGMVVPAPLRARFADAFATPPLTALPDFTFPARRDSQYGVSLRQWRFAESCELGVARRDDDRLVGALWTLYARGAAPAGDTGRWRSTAEAERNEPAVALDRAALGWRSLLHARLTLPPLAPYAVPSALLAGQGLAVFRRDAARTYVALDYGHAGGGHGHPDRLDVLLSHGADRWLDDPGTGSYVDPSLAWYRSTLAHTAPMVDGRSQRPADGVLLAYDERGGVGWVDAQVPAGGIAPGVRVRRSLVVMPDYAVDRLEWASDHAARFALPLHVDAEPPDGLSFTTGTLDGGSAAEDGFGFVRDARVAQLEGGRVVALRRRAGGTAWIAPGADAELWRLTAPGVPGSGPAEMYLVRFRPTATDASLAIVWSWAAAIADVATDGDAIAVRLADGAVHTHQPGDGTWHVGFETHGAHSSVDLDGRRATPVPPAADRSPAAPAPIPIPAAPAPPLTVILARDAYRTSEETWEEAGCPSATVSLGTDARRLVVEVDVRKTPVVFRPPDAPDPALDNEQPDIHSDGIQLYVDANAEPSDEPAAWLAVPIPGTDRLRVRTVDGARRDVPLDASWHLTGTGYHVRLAIPRAALGGPGPISLGMQVVVNDMAPGRERRRGQLVLTGGAGERVYLRGDREDRKRFARVILP